VLALRPNGCEFFKERIMNQYKVDFNTIEWESPIQGLRQKVHISGHQRLRLVEYSKELSAHWCEKGHIGYVLQGQFEMEYETEGQTYSMGDGIFIPNGAEHKHRSKVITDTVTVVFVEDI
jgi:mannose-6-phosphate isomerase-like protein (cupin superfamily)